MVDMFFYRDPEEAEKEAAETAEKVKKKMYLVYDFNFVC